MNIKYYLSIIAVLTFSIFGYLPNAYAELTIGNYSLQSKERANRTEFSYTYKADITNSGDDVENAIATVSSLSTNTKVKVDSLNFGSIGEGETITSNNSFTITQNRRFPFNPDDLVWETTAEPVIPNLPPDPGEEADKTVLGIDINGNGIRDDVERKIAIKHYPNMDKISVLNKQAISWLQALKPRNINNSNFQRKSNNELGLIMGCGVIVYEKDFDTYDVDSDQVDQWLHNTNKRLEAQSQANSHIHGQEFTLQSDEEIQTYCDELLQNSGGDL